MQSGYQEETERLRKIEYYRRWEQVKLSHPLRQLFWECTLRCNMECLHCGSDCRSSKTIADMPLADFLRVLDEVACHVDPGRVLVNTVGGEPLVRKDIVECGREITRRGFPWGMVSNGYLLTADMLERLLKAGLCTIAVSLDGLEPEHNWLRGNKNSFYHAVEAIKLLVQSESLTWDVITCVNKRNLSRLDELKDLLVRLGVKHWRCTTIFPSGRAAGNGELLLDDEEMTALMKSPYLMATASVVSVAGLRTICRAEKSIPPMRSPMTGLMKSLTKELTIAVNAPPTVIPTAISMTFPLEMNFLNSAKKPLFFI